MKSKGSFQEIPLEHGSLRKLESTLGKYVPKSSQVLNICKMALQNLIPSNLIHLRFYEFVGNDNDDDPFIVCIQEPNMCSKTGVIVFPHPNPSPEMIIEFEKLFDWTKPIVFQSTVHTFWLAHVSKLCEKHAGHTSGRGVVIRTWVLPNETASKLEVDSRGDNYTLKNLKKKDVPQLLANWIYGHSESERQIGSFLEILPSCGLFVEKEKGEELSSYLLSSPFGLSNILYTEEDHRGNGYAKKVIQWLAKEAAAKHGLDCVMETDDENQQSTGCLKRCGFQGIHKIIWYWFEPGSNN